MKSQSQNPSIIGICLFIMGVMVIGGSAGDCDGKCMDNVNTIEEMLLVIAFGLTMVGTGVIMIIKKFYNDYQEGVVI